MCERNAQKLVKTMNKKRKICTKRAEDNNF